VLGTANSLINAGSGTTAWALSAFAYCMVANPTCLAKVVDEVRSTFHAESEISLSKAEDMRYLNACIKESLRLYPPVGEGLPRETMRGGRVISGRYIPEGVSLNLSPLTSWRYSDLKKSPRLLYRSAGMRSRTCDSIFKTRSSSVPRDFLVMKGTLTIKSKRHSLFRWVLGAASEGSRSPRSPSSNLPPPENTYSIHLRCLTLTASS
jgi:hypothetical protein